LRARSRHVKPPYPILSSLRKNCNCKLLMPQWPPSRGRAERPPRPIVADHAGCAVRCSHGEVQSVR
jgi:hypothetical protein